MKFLLRISFATLATFAFISYAQTSKMKLYAIYTPSHRVLVDDWFLKSIKDDFDIILEEYDQECPSGTYYQSGWKKTTIHKVELWIEAVKDNWGKIFICSDVDIQFFKEIRPFIEKNMGDYDLLIQKNAPSGEVCSGFFACRGNERTLKLFEKMHAMMQTQADKSDQNSMNSLIRIPNLASECFDLALRGLNPSKVKWKHLPIQFFCGGTLTGRIWNPGMKLQIPENIMIHHANWTVGIANKIEQLKYVKNQVSKRNLEES